MHDQPIPAESDDALARAVLDLLTIDHPGHWSIAELARTVTPRNPSGTEDAVASLHAAGLLHRCGEFVFATRAAHEAQRLAS